MDTSVPASPQKLLLRALLRLALLLQGAGADLETLAYFTVGSPTGQVPFLDPTVGHILGFAESRRSQGLLYWRQF